MRLNQFNIGILSAAVVAAVAATSAVAAPLPLLSYTFNEGTGSSATNTGTANGALGDGTPIPAAAQFLNNNATTTTDLHGPGGSGVTGAATDFGLNLTSPTSQGTGPFTARVTRPAVQGLTSFTISGFFKADEVIGGNARLFALIDTNGVTAFQVSATAAGTLGFNVDAGGTTSGAAYNEVGVYDYFAVTYDGTKTVNNVVFYKGTTGPGAAFSTVATQTVNVGAVDTLPGNPFFAYIGNSNSGIRQFDGYLDNIQLYGSATDATGALSAADVQGIYNASVAVPEPTTLAALLGGGLLALRRRR